MTNILSREVPDDVISAFDDYAEELLQCRTSSLLPLSGR
jgi:hypothetical protein